MSSRDNNSNEAAPVNPAYGSGMFRRRIRLTSGDGWVFGELEDSSHAFRVKIAFDSEYSKMLLDTDIVRLFYCREDIERFINGAL